MHAQQNRYYSSKPRSWKGAHPVTVADLESGMGKRIMLVKYLTDKKSNLDGLSWPRTSINW